MGGCNSGGGRGALRTGYFLDLDLASLNRLHMLRPGFSGSLHWLRNGERIGTIGVWVQQDRIKLSYKSRPYGGEWESIEDTIPLVETEAGFGGRRKGGALVSCTGAGCTAAGFAGGQHTRANTIHSSMQATSGYVG